MEMTRRGLWHSAMAGGVANIWGHLPRGRDSWLGSAKYEHPEWIKTYATFFAHRFFSDMKRVNHLTGSACLTRPNSLCDCWSKVIRSDPLSVSPRCIETLFAGCWSCSVKPVRCS
jgi:hypothetical protein